MSSSSISSISTTVAAALVVICLISSTTCVEKDWFVTQEHLLNSHLMTHYMSSGRPVRNESDILNLTVTVLLNSLDNVNELEQSISVTGWLRQSWPDVQLVWDPKDFGGLRRIMVPLGALWYPDLFVINRKDVNQMNQVGPNDRAVVLYTGKVIWTTPLKMVTDCAMDLSHFPFDSQSCYISFTLSYTTDEVKMSASAEMNDTDFRDWFVAREHNNWHVTDLSFLELDTVDFGVEMDVNVSSSFSVLDLDIQLKRLATFASHMFILPSVTLCFMTPAVFLLPPASPEKITFGVGVLIADVLLLGELLKYIPTSQRSIPLIGKYFVANILLTSLSLAISIAVYNVWGRSRVSSTGPQPSCIQTVVLGRLAKFLFVDTSQTADGSDIANDLGNSQRNLVSLAAAEEAAYDNIQRSSADSRSGEASVDSFNLQGQIFLRKVVMSQWRHLAVVIDRIFFILYMLVVLCLTLAFAQYM